MVRRRGHLVGGLGGEGGKQCNFGKEIHLDKPSQGRFEFRSSMLRSMRQQCEALLAVEGWLSAGVLLGNHAMGTH